MIRYLMAVEIGEGKHKPNILGQPGKSAPCKYMAVFDLMQPTEALHCNVFRTEY